MKRFIKLIVLFILPLGLALASCVGVLYKAGELVRYNEMFPLKESQKYGLAYSDEVHLYKLRMTEEFFKSDIVALGSSRILQVKNNVINKDYTFYNAGLSVNNIYKFDLFLNQLSYSPKLFIINLDQWYFNPNYRDQKKTFSDKWFQEEDDNSLINKCIMLLKDVIKGKVSIKALMNNDFHSIGMNAIVNNSGYVTDGSYFYGGHITNPTKQLDYNFRDTKNKIKKGIARFQYCEVADSSVVEAIDVFLSHCEVEGIAVIAILPPFAPEVYEMMESMGKYSYMHQIYDMVVPIFNNHRNCYIYDYTDMSTMGVKDYDFVDGFHGSDLIYDYIIKDIIQKNEDVRHFFVDSVSIDSIIDENLSQKIRFHNL